MRQLFGILVGRYDDFRGETSELRTLNGQHAAIDDDRSHV